MKIIATKPITNRLIIVAVLLLIGSFTVLKAQNLTPKPFPVTPKSPNVSSIERFGNYEVNMFHGLPDISIDLFEIQSKQFKVPIKLSYHASGIKVSDVASWVGLGWSINTGGQISRKVKGKVDEEPSGFLNQGFRLRKSNEINPYNADGYLYLNRMLTGNSDTDPDVFTYSIPGNFGNFLYRGYDSSAIVVPYQPIKLQRNHNPQYSAQIMSFKLTDVSGHNYVFGNSLTGEDATERSESIRGSISSSFTSSWLLTDMIAGDNSDTIQFKYNNPTRAVLNQGTEDNVSVIDRVTSQFLQCSMSPSITNSFLNTSYAVNQRLMKEILFDKGKIEFVLSANDRSDLAAKSLDQVMIYSKVKGVYQLLKSVKFFYSYFTGYNTSRLKLDSISIQSSNALEKQVYRFSYKNTTNLPSVNSKSKDYWGYSNNNTSNQATLVPGTIIPYVISSSGMGTTTNIGGGFGSRDPDSNYVQMGILNRIQYPTGGYSVFFYEANKYKKGAEIKLGGGVRIKTILNYSAENSTPIIKSYTYGNEPDKENGLGILNSIVPVHFTPFSVNVESWSLYQGRPFPTCNYLYRNYGSNPTFDNNDFDETNVYYPFVTEYEGTRGNNSGKTTYQYTSQFDNILTSFISIRPQVESYHWQRGKLLEKKVYKKEIGNAYDLVYELDNNYKIVNPRTVQEVGCLVGEAIRREGSFDETVQYSSPLPFIYTFYNVYTGAYELSSSTERIYDRTLSVTKDKFYEYNNKAQIKLIKSVESNTDTLYQRFKYASDYNIVNPSGDAIGISKLNELNILNRPIEETYGVKPKQGTLRVTKGTIKTFYPTKPLLKDEYFLELSSPLTGFLESNITNGIFGYNAGYKKYISYTSYTPTNNISEYYLYDAGNKFAFLWGYNNSLMTTSGQNAGKDQIAYSSFEDNDKGNWTYTSVAVKKLTSDAISGEYVFDFTVSGQITKSAIPNGAYMITYWSKTPCKVNGADPIVLNRNSLRNINLYAHNVNVTAGTVSVTSTSAKIDDLSLQPSNSLMKTFAHLPLIGPSTISENQVVTYYQYDGLQRLKVVKDKNESVLNQYQYSNISPINLGVIGPIYYSKERSMIFKRNNCSATDYGTSTTYVVPANSYISFVSQADADNKATADVNSNGQAYANQTCECRPKTEVRWEPIEPYCQIKTIENPQPTTSGYGVTVSSISGTTDYTHVVLERTQAQASYKADVTFVIYFSGGGSISAHFVMEKGVTLKEGDIGVSPYLNANRSGGSVTNVENLDEVSLTGYQVYARRQKLVGGEITLTEPNLKDQGQGPYFEPILNTTGCPIAFIYENVPQRAAYANREMFKDFQKVCSSNQRGERVLYRIPVGRYTSSISQEDADNKAVNDINTNGQNYANQNGQCYPVPSP